MIAPVIDISTAKKRFSKNWKHEERNWNDFAAALKNPIRTNETQIEYNRMKAEEQSNVKDVGGFVGGILEGGARSANSVKNRTLLTLDADYADEFTWDVFQMFIGCTAVKYSTHKDRPNSRRFRIIAPYSRPVTPEEHEAVSRKIAELVGIDYFDDTTYQASRLMYFPSVSKDQDYDYDFVKGDPIDPDKFLALYHDWQDASEWAVSSRVGAVRRRSAERQGDPTTKPAEVGRFCRAYTIEEAIAEFLPDVYTPSDKSDRYTYVNGSTAAGLVLYQDGMFAYSNHASDPISGKLVNAFDLVRIHRFGYLDEGMDGENITKLPSYKAMKDFTRHDRRVVINDQQEREDEAVRDFGGLLNIKPAEKTIAAMPTAEEWDVLLSIDPPKSDFDILSDMLNIDTPPVEPKEKPETETEEDNHWIDRMKLDKNGNATGCAANLLLILMHDKLLKNVIKYDQFSHKMIIGAMPPWGTVAGDVGELWTDEADACMRNYLDVKYNITARNATYDAQTQVAMNNGFHPVKQFIEKTKWDGVPRVESLLIDYLGAEDNAYTRAVTKATLVGAIKRIYEAGCKHDEMLVLCGKQAIGKTTFVQTLANNWFGRIIGDVESKDALQAMDGCWLMEMGEMRATKRSDNNAMKNFLSGTEDRYRPAYGRNVKVFKRQCIFIGTTNDDDFLQDETGDRRSYPITCHGIPDGWEALKSMPVNQIWAEAKVLYDNGASNDVASDIKSLATLERDKYRAGTEIGGLIGAHLDIPVPAGWDDMPISQRLNYISNIQEGETEPPESAKPRTHTCVMEILKEMYYGDLKMRSAVLKYLKGCRTWQSTGKNKRFKVIGTQKEFTRVED